MLNFVLKISDSLDLSRLTVLYNASEDALDNLAHFRCLLFSQFHQSKGITVALSAKNIKQLPVYGVWSVGARCDHTVVVCSVDHLPEYD